MNNVARADVAQGWKLDPDISQEFLDDGGALPDHWDERDPCDFWVLKKGEVDRLHTAIRAVRSRIIAKFQADTAEELNPRFIGRFAREIFLWYFERPRPHGNAGFTDMLVDEAHPAVSLLWPLNIIGAACREWTSPDKYWTSELMFEFFARVALLEGCALGRRTGPLPPFVAIETARNLRDLLFKTASKKPRMFSNFSDLGYRIGLSICKTAVATRDAIATSIETGGLARMCRGCRRLFVPIEKIRADRLYCGEACRKAQELRRARKRKGPVFSELKRRFITRDELDVSPEVTLVGGHPEIILGITVVRDPDPAARYSYDRTFERWKRKKIPPLKNGDPPN